jgi:hypothetical protein
MVFGPLTVTVLGVAVSVPTSSPSGHLAALDLDGHDLGHQRIELDGDGGWRDLEDLDGRIDRR